VNNPTVDLKRWAQLTLIEQMGNIGSEVGRAINARRNGKPERVEGAIIRALDLFSATVECLIVESPHHLREVLRARTEFLSLFYNDTFDTDADKIEHYFMQYAVAARKAQTKSRN